MRRIAIGFAQPSCRRAGISPDVELVVTGDAPSAGRSGRSHASGSIYRPLVVAGRMPAITLTSVAGTGRPRGTPATRLLGLGERPPSMVRLVFFFEKRLARGNAQAFPRRSSFFVATARFHAPWGVVQVHGGVLGARRSLLNPADPPCYRVGHLRHPHFGLTNEDHLDLGKMAHSEQEIDQADLFRRRLTGFLLDLACPRAWTELPWITILLGQDSIRKPPLLVSAVDRHRKKVSSSSTRPALRLRRSSQPWRLCVPARTLPPQGPPGFPPIFHRHRQAVDDRHVIHGARRHWRRGRRFSGILARHDDIGARADQRRRRPLTSKRLMSGPGSLNAGSNVLEGKGPTGSIPAQRTRKARSPRSARAGKRKSFGQ